MLRLRILSDKKLSWRQSLEISLLWEFASAISPSVIGGTAVALVIMAQEKLETGRTTAIVLITSFLDEVFFHLNGSSGFLVHRDRSRISGFRSSEPPNSSEYGKCQSSILDRVRHLVCMDIAVGHWNFDQSENYKAIYTGIFLTASVAKVEESQCCLGERFAYCGCGVQA
jgi:hypothetical protein